MNNNLLQKLKDWRKAQANSEGVPLFRVFSNDVLEAIAQFKPTDKDALFLIKGIRDRKYNKYGEAVLALVNGEQKEPEFFIDDFEKEDKPFSVSTYLDSLNERISNCHARIQGEISSVDIRERVIYFSLKDSDDESIINCLIWRRNYELGGIEFEIGMEIIIDGIPDIYKPSGRLAFKANSAELVGEGALKTAYDKLKKKLSEEGLFLEERKKEIPDFPQKIGLVTSKTGAVINDFSANLGKYGFFVNFFDSRVEGQTAVSDLVSSIDYFFDKDIDVLVIIRGGGSFESMQAFNNEILVRKIAGFNKPVICGIGHEKDIPLASLVADKMVSTPTAVTQVLNESWKNAGSKLDMSEQKIFRSFQNVIQEKQNYIRDCVDKMKNIFQKIFNDFLRAQESLKIGFKSIKDQMLDIERRLSGALIPVFRKMNFSISNIRESISGPIIKQILGGFLSTKDKLDQLLKSQEKQLFNNDPQRQLRLGYSIVRKNGRILKTVNQIQKGDIVSVGLSEGAFDSEVKIISNK